MKFGGAKQFVLSGYNGEKIHVPKGVAFTAIAKGIGTSISYEKDGKQTEAFSVPEAENIIELNGIKSELVISISKEGA